jgi:S-adenosylmethionine:tRNA ribosyltransferase-isomerase
MRKSDFRYELPPDLIAQKPVTPRSASRLLHLDGASGERRDLLFRDLPSLLRAGDLLVFNDTRVIPARLHGAKDTGGRVEVLIERLLDGRRVRAQVRASKPPKPEQKIHLDGGAIAQVTGRSGEFYEIEIEGDEPLPSLFERIGHMPLPPYIERDDEPGDRTRYQTVFAREPGAVAAPTAGLHFDEPLLAQLRERGVEFAYVTLHVGAGTFQPLRVEDLREHRMHPEWLTVSDATAASVNATKREGRRVIAVGTTVVRALETAAGKALNKPVRGEPVEPRTDEVLTTSGISRSPFDKLRANERVLMPFLGETDIFIYPGYRFRVVDALITNFHLPESTLLMLVCAFAGTDNVLAAYHHAVEQRYRFYSYGDAMFVTPSPDSR